MPLRLEGFWTKREHYQLPILTAKEEKRLGKKVMVNPSLKMLNNVMYLIVIGVTLTAISAVKNQGAIIVGLIGMFVGGGLYTITQIILKQVAKRRGVSAYVPLDDHTKALIIAKERAKKAEGERLVKIIGVTVAVFGLAFLLLLLLIA